MRALIVMVAWLAVGLPATAFAQDNGASFDQVVAADDRGSCDEIAWTASESEWAAATTEDFLFEHAACSTDLQMLMAGCFDPVNEPPLGVDPKPGYDWLSC